MSENLRDMIWFFEFSDRRRRKKKRGSEIRDYIEEARGRGSGRIYREILHIC
ncbi:hypothetical protein ISS96_02065 [Candidatus Bathyarchaeota archaeon]|nr:hypothetical protein [Candidatus Bathyarchaeota archaeon]